MSNSFRRDILKGALAGAGALTAAAAPPAAAQTGAGGSHWEQPHRQQGNNRNVILLVSDTFRADNLAAQRVDRDAQPQPVRRAIRPL